MLRTLLKLLALIVALLLVVALAGDVYLRRSLPLVNGTVSVSGISTPVDIVRDADQVTHIFAATKLDALFGLGYAHAQDRLWQMEFQRRVGNGRLSEIFGLSTLATDRFLRTIGTGRAARAAWAALPADARRQVDAYVAGVNAFIRTHHGSGLPPEFTLLRFEPEPWSGADVLAWVKMMAWDLSKNYSSEIFRHDVIRTMGASALADLMPPYTSKVTILSASDGPSVPSAPEPVVSRPRPADRAASAWSESFARGLSDIVSGGTNAALGSNNWVVDGTMTASGKPLLANDPHLGAQIPSLWYLAHMSAGDFDVIGATLPGTPAVAIGRNRFIAWGETNAAVDVEDLFRERLDSSGKLAEFNGRKEPLREITETIIVKGSAPVAVHVRISRHGPLVSDAINANNARSDRDPKPAPLEPIAFRWTALDSDDSTLAAFLHLNEAKSWGEFTTALRSFVVPSQNFVYADVFGHIGYYAPGRVPIRTSGDGSVPSDGWTGDGEWQGWVPFEELPHTFDPPEHFIVTANHRPVPWSFPRPWNGEWTEPFRAERIIDLLSQRGRSHASGRVGLVADDFAAIQSDTLSLHAQSLLPTLLARVHPPTREDERAVALLRAWDDDARGDSAAAAIFQAWFLELTNAIAGDELGRTLTVDYMALERTSYVARFLARTLATPDNAWCDDVRTPKRETCDEVVSMALRSGVARLTAQLGANMDRWRWDAVHRAVFPHSPLDSVAALRPFVSRRTPHGGDWSTVNVGPVFAPRPFEQHTVAGYRQIVDLSPANDSRFLDAVGQSGHPLSKHYDDSLADWATGRYRRMRMDRQDIERGATGHLRLVPN